MHRINAIGQILGLRKTVLITDEIVALGFFRRVIAACGFKINRKLRAGFGRFDLCAAIVRVLDNGDIALDDGFDHIQGGAVQLDGIKLRLRAHMVACAVQQIALGGVDFADTPVRITDIIAGGKLTVCVRGIAVDEGVALIQPIGRACKRGVALRQAGFAVGFGKRDIELFEDVRKALIRHAVPFHRRRLLVRHYIANCCIYFLQRVARADEHIAEIRLARTVGNGVFIDRKP
ncbi:uncharacterized protein BN621_00635 [Clostridium sp. CAG:352]|nr:uncharacterized protein BN621_00635 [Clostridium sp. CAG:352]